MGTTTHGLPYPEPTDAVAAGADAIKALALAIDPKVTAGTLIGFASGSALAGIGNTSAQIPGMVVSWTPRTSHRYLILAQFDLTKVGPIGEAFPAIYLNPPGTNLRSTTESFTAANYASPIVFTVWTAPSATAVGMTGQMSTNAGSIDVRGANMVVIDLGL